MMTEKLDEALDQLSDEEIEARLAAAVWVDDKRAAVLRYLEEKKLGRKKEAQRGELELARSAKEAAWQLWAWRRRRVGAQISQSPSQALQWRRPLHRRPSPQPSSS